MYKKLSKRLKLFLSQVKPQIKFLTCSFFFFNSRLFTKHMLQLQNFKTKRKYIMILQIESKLHKNEKE